MNKIILSVLCFILLFFSFTAAVDAFEMTTVNGSAHFKCNFLSKFMEKYGYFYINEIPYEKTKINIFAAKEAEVIIKNRHDTIMGIGKADKKGNFSISVPKDNNYKIIVTFHDRQIEEEVDYFDTDNFTADLGFFSTEEVENWFQIPALSYCHSCDIRYMENKESFNKSL